MSQLNFFLTKDEIHERIKKLNIENQFLFFKGRFFDNNKPVPLIDVQDICRSQQLIIWVKNSFKKPICYSKGAGEYSDHFLFDYYTDPILELSNCQYKNKLISPGRIYYKSGWIDNPELRELHRKMANKVMRVFGKGLTKVSSSFKISEDINKFILSGYEIELGNGGLRLNATTINSLNS